MSRKFYTYKKYEDSRKRTYRFLDSLAKGNKKSRRRKKTTTKSKARSKTTKSTVKQGTSNGEPMTFGEFLAVIAFFALLALFVVLWIKWSFWKSLLIIAALVISISVILVLKDEVVNKTNQQSNTKEQGQIEYLQELQRALGTHQNIINNSSNPSEVKLHLDALLAVMDEIMTYDEALLNQVGMTKKHAISTKEEVLGLYDILIEQAGNQ